MMSQIYYAYGQQSARVHRYRNLQLSPQAYINNEYKYVNKNTTSATIINFIQEAWW